MPASIIEPTPKKACTKCQHHKPFSDYHKDRTRKDGMASECKACVLARMKARYAENAEAMRLKATKYRAENPDKIQSGSAAYRAANKEKTLSATRLWRHENPILNKVLAAKYYAKMPRAIARARWAIWAASNKESIRLRGADWRARNPERSKAIGANRRARKAGAPGRHTPEQIILMHAMQGGCCAVCRKKLDKKYHRDHVTPLLRGGSNDIGNIQLLCASCNISKGAKDPVEFMQSRGFLL